MWRNYIIYFTKSCCSTILIQIVCKFYFVHLYVNKLCLWKLMNNCKVLQHLRFNCILFVGPFKLAPVWLKNIIFLFYHAKLIVKKNTIKYDNNDFDVRDRAMLIQREELKLVWWYYNYKLTISMYAFIVFISTFLSVKLCV